MAVTAFQRDVCRLLAAHRLERGESYVAAGTALNLLAGGTRISRGALCRQPPERLRAEVEGGALRFHAGSIRVALPRIVESGG